ncbi:LOW QUALITY PROTEIN: hypothetical protein ACHAXT_004858 [Thalassiosira profunda]
MNPAALLLLALPLAAAFQPRAPPAAATARRPPNDACTDASSARRAFLASTLAAAGATLLPSASTAADSLVPYEDTEYGFKFQVPASCAMYQPRQQRKRPSRSCPGRRKAVFFTDPASKDAAGNIETLGFVAYTPLRDDFTSLSSFGSVDEVAQSTILPKGELLDPKDAGASKMLSATSKNNAYFFDYVAAPVVPTAPGSGSSGLTETLKMQHFRTIFTLLPLQGNAGLTLVTVTLQTTEERYGGMKGTFDGAIDSFGKI